MRLNVSRAMNSPRSADLPPRRVGLASRGAAGRCGDALPTQRAEAVRRRQANDPHNCNDEMGIMKTIKRTDANIHSGP